MHSDIKRQIEALEEMNGPQLRAAYIAVFNERPHSNRHQWLKSRIAWGIQAKAEDGMSQRFINYGLENADLSELRVTAPRTTLAKKSTAPKHKPASEVPDRDPRIPKPGTVLERKYKGRNISITILPSGFQWEEEVHASLSAALKAATGASYSPYVFFKLGSKSKPAQE